MASHGRRFLPDQRGLDGGKHFADVLRVGRLAFFHLHNVVPELALHDFDVADLLRGVGKRRHLAIGRPRFIDCQAHDAVGLLDLPGDFCDRAR